MIMYSLLFADDGIERPVDVLKCQQTKPLLAQACTLECSWDCSVSLWSAWSECQDLECDKANIRKRRADDKTGTHYNIFVACIYSFCEMQIKS